MSTTYQKLLSLVKAGKGVQLGWLLHNYAARTLTSAEVARLLERSWHQRDRGGPLAHWFLTMLRDPLPGLLLAARANPALATFAFSYPQIRDGLFWGYCPARRGGDESAAIRQARSTVQDALITAMPAHLARYILEATFPIPPVHQPADVGRPRLVKASKSVENPV